MLNNNRVAYMQNICINFNVIFIYFDKLNVKYLKIS